MDKTSILISIAILGGTGKEGQALAYRWAKAGYHVLIGSRSEERAKEMAGLITDLLDGDAVIQGCSNLEAARRANVVVVTVPYSAHRNTLEEVRDSVQGKLVIDVTVPLVPPNITKVQMPSAGSATQEAQEILGSGVDLCSAFQNISYELLLEKKKVDCDVLVTGTSKKARLETLKLVNAIGMKGWDAGPIENSLVVEGLTSILININKQYGATHAGIKITGAQHS